MIYTVYIQINPKQKVTCPVCNPEVRADSILDHILEYLLIVSIHNIIAISFQ